MRIAKLTFIFVAGCIATVSLAQAQNKAPRPMAATPKPDPSVTKIFALKHVNASTIQSVLTSMVRNGELRVAVSGDDRLIVSANGQTVENVAELIEQLDQPPHDATEGVDRSIEIMKLKKLAPEDAIGLIEALLISHDQKSTLMVVPDPNSGSIIARGTPIELSRVEDFLRKYETQQDDNRVVTELLELNNQPTDAVYELLESIKGKQVNISRVDDARKLLLQGPQQDIGRIFETVAQIDRPNAPLHLTFFFVRSSHDEEIPVPESLHPALVALEETGFENPHLLTTLTIRTQENSVFTTSGTIENDRVSVEGEARFPGDKGAIHIRVEAEVTRRRPDTQDGTRQNDEVPVFHAATEILAPVGDSVVVASAPGPVGSESPVALILQARPAE